MSKTNYTMKKSDLNRCWLSWMQHCACGYNYAKMMGSGMAHVMRIPISKFYDTKEEQGKEIEKHLTFFNTEPHIGSLIVGTVIAMEEDRAQSGMIEADDIIKIKSSLMGPFAGIGDSLIQGAFVPIFLSIGVSMALQGNILGPVLFALVCCGACLLVSHYLFFQGYKMGKEAITRIMSNGFFQQIMAGAGIVGCMVMGALTAGTVTTKFVFEITAGESIINVQTALFDAIFLGIIPLTIVAAIMKAFNKGAKPITVLFTTLIISFILGALGIIA